MKEMPYIRNSIKFYGKYEVVASKNDVIPCYNYATALTIKRRIIDEQRQRKKTRME